MMVSVETYLLRGKRRLENLLSIGWISALGRGALYAGSGFALSGASLWGTMQPGAMALVACSTGWRCICAALGSAAGYRIFWGQQGYQGAVWAVGALLLALLSPLFGDGLPRRRRMAVGCACLVSASGLVYQFRFADPIPVSLFFARMALAAGFTALGGWISAGRDRTAQWICMALAVYVLCQLPVPGWCNPGMLAAGFLTAGAPLPAAALAGIGADLSRIPAVPMSAAACLSFFLQKLPLRRGLGRSLSPGAACLGIMVLQWRWDQGMLLAVSLGGAIGSIIPWQIGAVPRHSGVGTAQVQLEQGARVMSALQRQLLEYTPPPPDAELLLERLKQEQCTPCQYQESCREKERLKKKVLTSGEAFVCRKGAAMEGAIAYFRDQRKRMHALRAMQEDYRLALIRQYGFLSDALRSLSDRLPERQEQVIPRYRVLVSARSRGKESANGDHVAAFPGIRCRYYVVLCDGMGTGLGAAEEGRQTAELIKMMLCAGLSPASALGSINSQLTLLSRGGAVTVDLTELRLDSGNAWVYKWGASPGWLLHRGKAEKIGYATPPPGTFPETGRESTGRVSLARGETLVMTSDGVDAVNASGWAVGADDTEPSVLAQRILTEGSSREDDATAVVIRLAKIR